MSDNNSCIKEFLHEAIAEGIKWESERPDPQGWRGSKFAAGRNLQIDGRGKAGEKFVESVLQRLGKKVKRDEGTSPDKEWDLEADGIKLEVKTATLGATKAISFQHDGVEKKRGYDGIVFVDIAPDDIYISFMAKRDVHWKRFHNRRYGVHYKMDFRLFKGEKDKVFVSASRRLKLPRKAVGRKMKTLDEFAVDYEAMVKRIKADPSYRG